MISIKTLARNIIPVNNWYCVFSQTKIEMSKVRYVELRTVSNSTHTVWKKPKFTLTWKKFREINSKNDLRDLH